MITDSPEQTIAFGMELGRRLKGRETVALYGDLGAGKTTLIKGIVRGFGIDKLAKSPSFIMVTEYTAEKKTVYHIDLYRLQSKGELENIGILDYLAAPAVKLIEWAEKIEEILPKETIRVSLKIISENRREIKITESGEER